MMLRILILAVLATGIAGNPALAAEQEHCPSCPVLNPGDLDDDDDDDDGVNLHFPRRALGPGVERRDHRGDCDYCVSASLLTKQCCWEAQQAGKDCAECSGEKVSSAASCCSGAEKPKDKESGMKCSGSGPCHGS